MYHALLADDVKFNRKIIKMHLNKIRDYEIAIHEAANGFEVFEILAQQEIDIIILDLVMPGKDGFAVLQELKGRNDYRNIPIIVQSALENPDYIEQALALGAYDYFVKSDMHSLHLKVRNAINSYILYKDMQRELAERLRAESSLKISEERYRAIVSQSFDAIVLVEIENGRLIECNQSFATTLGYTQEELLQLSIVDVCAEDLSSILHATKELRLRRAHLEAEVRRYRRKDGLIIHVERTVTLISYGDKDYSLIIARNITEEMDRQAELKRDMLLAEKVQRGFLPLDMENDWVQIKGIYSPVRGVSGDLYDFVWDEEHKILTGYILDISGHGIGTALIGAALKSLFHQAGQSFQTLSEQMSWLNMEILPYCHDDFFAAAFRFVFHFQTHTLSYCSAGINQFMRCSAGHTSLELVRGQLIGVFEEANFVEESMTFRSGDVFVFFSDGLLDVLPQNLPGDFTLSQERLERLVAEDKNQSDDVTVIAIQING